MPYLSILFTKLQYTQSGGTDFTIIDAGKLRKRDVGCEEEKKRGRIPNMSFLSCNCYLILMGFILAKAQ
jgi:hypothetical protein